MSTTETGRMDGHNGGTGDFDPSHFFESFIRIARALLLGPRLFYRTLPAQGRLRSPILFFLTNSFLAALCIANYRGAGYQAFAVLIASNICSAFAAGLLLHGAAVRLCGSPAGPAATVRIIAYASIVDVAAWIPVVGIVPYCYGLYLIFLGLQELHQMKPRQAGMALMAIILLVTLLFAGLLLMAPESVQEGMRLLDPQQT